MGNSSNKSSRQALEIGFHIVRRLEGCQYSHALHAESSVAQFVGRSIIPNHYIKKSATAERPKASIPVLAGFALFFIAAASAQVPVPDQEATPRPATSEHVGWEKPVVKIERVKCHASNGSRPHSRSGG
jgi:hypothetical protein